MMLVAEPLPAGSAFKRIRPAEIAGTSAIGTAMLFFAIRADGILTSGTEYKMIRADLLLAVNTA